MRILHVVPYFPPAWGYGGPPRAVYEISRRQVKDGHRVTVLTTDAYEKHRRLLPGKTTHEGVEVIRVRNLTNALMWHLHFCTPLVVPSSLDVGRYDVVHLHEVRTFLNVMALGQIRPGQTVVLSPWGTLPHNDQLTPIKWLFDQVFLDLFRQRVSLSLGQNRHELDVIGESGIGRSAALVPLGVDLSSFVSLPSREDSRHELGLGDDVFLFLYLGRFAKAKGLDLLLWAFAQLLHRREDTQLMMVGRDDGFLGQMEQLVRVLRLDDRAAIRGPMYGTHRLKAYVAADAFVCVPSAYEETSTACLEALACGVPVITTRQAEIPFFDRQDGVLHVERSLDGIVRAMDEVCRLRPKVNASLLSAHCDWDSIVRTIEKAYYHSQSRKKVDPTLA